MFGEFGVEAETGPVDKGTDMVAEPDDMGTEEREAGAVLNGTDG